jgi:hypothetical protein
MNISLEIVGHSSNDTSARMNKGCDLGEKSATLLKTALIKGSQDVYKEALLLEKYRDALLDQANELRSEMEKDIIQKAKKIAPVIFGWNNTEIPGLNCNLTRKPAIVNEDYEDIWETLVGLELQDYRLEDPKISADFFGSMQKSFLKHDLSKVNPKHLTKYPWLKTSIPEEGSRTAAKPLLRKKPKSSSSLFSYKKTTSQQRLEKELALKEEELQKRLATSFRAKNIPESSLALRYGKIMENQGTRSTRIREEALKRKVDQKNRKEAREIILKQKLRKPLVSEAYSPPAAPYLGPGERRKSIMKDILKECTFKPKVGAKMPDFKREHEKFKGILEMSKSIRSSTIPVPFSFSRRS